MPELFRLEEVGFCYAKDQTGLSGINLAVNEGEILSIIGSNGSGKSTLLNIICGLVFPNKGKISFKGRGFNEKSLKDSLFNREFRSSIGYVFQNSEAQLFCPTVFDEIIFGPLQAGISRDESESRAEDIMKMLNISELRDRPVYMLSGGEKKRVAIGAVLASNPEVLVIDEPVSGLDPKTRAFLIELIFKLNEVGKTIILATHHLELVDHLQSRVVVLSEKHTVEKTGKCDEILCDTELLLRSNLIGEIPHRHKETIHKHLSTGFLFHNHKPKTNS
ncbi:MAG: ABC transporter ATP-binding protein [Bacteroidales bacterium]|nr:ABC transporter ATP-binding protein [Bacteroidales bacterium]